MTMYEAQAVVKIRDIGVNNVHVRPVAFNGWAILHQTDMYHAETLFSADTKAECDAIVRIAAQ